MVLIVSTIKIDLIIIIYILLVLLVFFPFVHNIWVHLVWTTLRNVVAVLVHLFAGRIWMVKWVVPTHHFATLWFSHVCLGPKILTLTVLFWIFEVLLVKVLIVCFTFSLVILVWLAETIFIVLAQNLRTYFGCDLLLWVANFRRQYSFVALDDMRAWLLDNLVHIYTFIFISVLWSFTSKVIEILMVYCLSGSYTLVRVHVKQFFHQIYFNIIHYRCISHFNGFWVGNIRKF